MSSAALAKKRRAAPINNTPVVNNQQQLNNQPSQLKLTLPQALSILESRITKLESLSSSSDKELNTKENNDIDLKELVNEYENRFELLINEINNLKDTVFKLQTFTMEVNKDLYENIKKTEKNVLDVVQEEDNAPVTDDAQQNENNENSENNEITFS